MTEAKRAALIFYLDEECKDDGYEIFSDEDFLTIYPASLGVEREELRREISKLHEEGYIDVRYAEAGTYCLAVKEKGRRYEGKICPRSLSFRIFDGWGKSFFPAFLGGACGALFAAVLAGLLRLLF